MTPAIKQTILAALAQYRGDDLERAKAFFGRFTAEQMEQQHGESGKTRTEILREYHVHAEKTEAAVRFVEAA